ncbi:MAG: TrkA family potassium uptake protein [Firmicutes bacterium]|nr:TrkA family potassium uptake protein [Bacillota bacterium]
MKQYVVIGLGRFGGEVARALEASGNEVLGIDNDPARVQALGESLTHAIVADGADIEVLNRLGLRNFDCAVVSVGANLESSVLITLNLKELGIKKVVAKAHGDLHGKILAKVGADTVVFPEREMAAKLAENLVADNVLDLMELGSECAVVEMMASGDMVGKTLEQLRLRQRYGVNVVAIKRDNQVDLAPQPDRVIGENDVLVIIGRNASIRSLEHRA